MAEQQAVKQKDPPPASQSRARIASYIADLTEEMMRLARREEMDVLSERLGAAAREARRISQAD